MALVLAVLVSIPTLAAAQTPSDARGNQFVDPKGTSWQVFAVDSHPAGPLGITQVEEVRQHNPPSLWGVYVQNRASAPVASFVVAAAIVTGDGAVKAMQPLPAIKNLKPGQVVRRQMRVTATVLGETDRVAFFVREVTGDAEPWRADDADVRTLIKLAAARLPVP
ncbi:MAG: hypothetical protein IT178_16095 [Acidobacteria bacterium]|nr:hypothetical protein [Acidobacteriota bacterium]